MRESEVYFRNPELLVRNLILNIKTNRIKIPKTQIYTIINLVPEKKDQIFKTLLL